MFEHFLSNRTTQCPKLQMAHTPEEQKKLPVAKMEFGEIMHPPCHSPRFTVRVFLPLGELPTKADESLLPGFEIRVFLPLGELPTKADESFLPGFEIKSFPSPRRAADQG